MNQKLVKAIIPCILLATATLLPFCSAAYAQSPVRAEGTINWKLSPRTGVTTLKFSRLANYSYEDQDVHAGILVSKKAYRGDQRALANFSKNIGWLPARSFANSISVSGIGRYPTSGTYKVYILVGVTNQQGSISVAGSYGGKSYKLGGTRRRSLTTSSDLIKGIARVRRQSSPDAAIELVKSGQ